MKIYVKGGGYRINSIAANWAEPYKEKNSEAITINKNGELNSLLTPVDIRKMNPALACNSIDWIYL